MLTVNPALHASTLGLVVHLLVTDPSMPVRLGVADETSMKVTGITNIHLPVLRTDIILHVSAAVVSALFCPALLGRNALQAFDNALGNCCVYSDSFPSPIDSALLGLSESHLRDRIAVTSVAVVYLAANATTWTINVGTGMHAVFLVPKADLMPPSGPCINKLQGIFTAGTCSHAPTCLLANSAVTAVVDWTPAGSHGKLCAVSFLTLATSTAHAGEQRVLNPSSVLELSTLVMAPLLQPLPLLSQCLPMILLPCPQQIRIFLLH
jgi:hypothetical protein